MECAFFSALYGSYATAALFTDKLDGAVEPQELIHSIRFRVGPTERIAEVGRFSQEVSRTLLATMAQMDRQPALRGQGRPPNLSSSRYLHRLPTLLVCAMTVHAARRCLEGIAFVLVAWAQNSIDTTLALTLMEAAAQHVRQLSPASSSESAYTIAQVSADYIDEMIETARLWQVYYRVYRPVSSVKPNQDSGAATAGHGVDPGQGRSSNETATAGSIRPSAPSQVTAMDFLVSAAEAARTSGLDLSLPSAGRSETDDPLPASREARTHADANRSIASSIPPDMAEPPFAWSAQDPGFQQLDSGVSVLPGSNHAGLGDADFYNACLPFDLEAFLKNVDQLF